MDTQGHTTCTVRVHLSGHLSGRQVHLTGQRSPTTRRLTLLESQGTTLSHKTATQVAERQAEVPLPATQGDSERGCHLLSYCSGMVSIAEVHNDPLAFLANICFDKLVF